MQAACTYMRRGALAALAGLTAASLVPAPALARTADGVVGVLIEVPAQAFVEPTDDAKAASGTVGIRMEVPAQALAGAVGGAGGPGAAEGTLGIRLEVPRRAIADAVDASKGAGGMLGIRMEVPSQAYTGPTDDTKATGGLLGIRMEVPKQAFTETGDDTKAASGLLGIRLELPKQAVSDPGSEAKAASGLLGIRVKVASKHTVVFNANGGSPDTSAEVMHGACASAPDPVIATRDKYRVVAWCTSPDCAEGTEYDFSEPVLGNLVLYAKWAGPECEEGAYLLHMGDGAEDAGIPGTDKAGAPGEDGAWVDGSTYKGRFLVGKGAALPEPVRAGYVFRGWYEGESEEAALAGAAVSHISKDWPAAGGSAAEVREFWAKWEKIVEPPVPGESCTVTFDTAGGSDVAPVVVATGSTVARPAPDPVRSGYAFAGWYADADRRVPFDFASPVEADTTVWAKWKRIPGGQVVEHTVAFDTLGGSTVPSQHVSPGKTVKAPADPVRSGYAFVGWYADRESALAAGDAGRFDFSVPVERDTTVYAGWKALVFTVVFDAAGGAFEGAGAGGTDVPTVTVEVTGGGAVSPEDVPVDPKRAGWQFAGWRVAPADGSGELGEKWDPASTVTADTTLRAEWDLRLDVTVPVSVGFAVDADSHAVTTPDAERYALKSRTVKDVTVDAVELTSEEEELGAFFALPEGEAWGPVLGETTLSLRARDAGPEVSIALAGAGEEVEAGVWKNARDLGPDERDAFTISAFSYGGRPFDEAWQGADPSSSLPVKLGMTVPGKLNVRTDLDGPQKITRLTLTVSARE